LVSGQLAWDLGYGWGFSYLLGAYIDYKSPVAWSDTSLNQRFALSYTGNDWGITANVIWGIHLDSVTDRSQLSPCPIVVSPTFPTGAGCNPNFINVDLTVGHSFGKWQVAWVGFYSSDLTEPILGYQKQSQFAMGGLLGYDFGPVVLQGYLTSDVYEKNYGGKDVRGWVRVVLPLTSAGGIFGPPAPAPAPSPMVRGSR
jgi:Putative MetA-pathway of phenol degradation